MRASRNRRHGCSGSCSAGWNGMLVPICRMECPFAGSAWIRRCFEPALRRQDVVPAITVEIAHANPVAVALRADNVFYPLPSGQFEPGKGHIGPVKFGKKLECF